MLKKMMYAAILCSVFAVGATTAQAVTIDLSSPQEGTTVYPGDMVELTVEVTNDWDKRDIVHVELTITIGDRYAAKGRLRMRMAPGEVITQTISAVIPEQLPVTEPMPVTLEAVAIGRRSKTEDSDTISLTLAPLP